MMYPIRKTKLHTTTNPSINVLMHYTPHEDGTIRISGYAVDAKTGIRLDGVKAKVKQAKAPEDIALKEGYLIHAILTDLPITRSAARHSQSSFPEGTFSEAFQELKYGNDNISPKWDPSTRDRHMAYFRLNILPFLAKLEAENLFLTVAELEALKSKLIQQTLESKKSKQNMRSIHKTVNSSLAAAEAIYQRMREIRPDLPDIHLHDGARVVSFQPEHAKSLPAAVRYAMVRRLEELVELEPDFAFRAICMFAFGLRDAEACAVTLEQIIFLDLYVLICVEQQIKDEKISKVLKTSNAYRIVIGPYWALIMLKRCVEHLAAMGKTVRPYMDVTRFSSRLKRMLIDCGCQEGFFRAAQLLMDRYPDCIDDAINMDIMSYILRRDYASRGKNTCGLSNDEIDALLGHKRMKGAKRSQVNLARVDDQARIAEKLERFVYNSGITLNPEFHPVSLHPDQDLTVIPFNAYTYQNDSNSEIRVDLYFTTAEPDEEIELITHTEADVVPLSSSFTPKKREIIGIAYPASEKKEPTEDTQHEE